MDHQDKPDLSATRQRRLEYLDRLIARSKQELHVKRAWLPLKANRNQE
jgi:hypothetical protein